MTDELTKTLLVEDVAPPHRVAEALHASVVRGVPFVRALLEGGAVAPALLDRYLARSPARAVERVAPLLDVGRALPDGLCERLLAVPVARDAATGTVDVAMVDPSDAHAAAELGFHLGAEVRVLRASLVAVEDGLRRLEGVTSRLPVVPAADASDEEEAPVSELAPRAPAPRAHLVVADDDDLSSRPAPPPRGSHSLPPSPAAALGVSRRRRKDTPPWGTPMLTSQPSSDAPKSGLGSEIPIPLTRRTFTAVSGGTQRPPPLVDPSASALGEGYPVDAESLRAVVEVNDRAYAHAPVDDAPPSTARDGDGRPELSTSLAAVRAAASRDDILDRLLASAEQVARRVGIFVVKKGGYVGWSCNRALADAATLGQVVLALDSGTIFDRAVKEELYLGPLPADAVHAPLARVVEHTSEDVAVVPVRVLGKTPVVIFADELEETMAGTRHLDELARAAGEALTRLVRERR